MPQQTAVRPNISPRCCSTAPHTSAYPAVARHPTLTCNNGDGESLLVNPSTTLYNPEPNIENFRSAIWKVWIAEGHEVHPAPELTLYQPITRRMW